MCAIIPSKPMQWLDKKMIFCCIVSLLLGAVGCFFWLIHTAHFDPPGNFWAGLGLAFAAPWSIVAVVLVRRFRAREQDPRRRARISYAAALLWSALVMSLTAMAYAKWSPTTYAIRHNIPALTGMLIQAGIAVNKRDIDGQTPLGLAIIAGDANLVADLLRHGADVNLEIIVRQPRTVVRYTPLKLAIMRQDDAIIGLLRPAGAKETLPAGGKP